MHTKRRILISAIFLLLASTLTPISADSLGSLPATTNPWEVDVMLRSSIYLPTPRPVADVYFELNSTTPNLVYRIEQEQARDPIVLAKMAYATISAIPHDPYKLTPNALGPFPKGDPLGFSLEEWLSAIGFGTYFDENGNASIHLTFHNLVPNGTYSIWCHRVTSPPNYKEENTPLGASDGSQSIFKADANGNGTFNLKFKALPATTNVSYADWASMYITKMAPIRTNVTWTLIGVVYHSDGQTHGAIPGEFGKNAHLQLVHLMYPKPARTFEEWKNATAASAINATESAKKQPGFESLSTVAGLLAIAFLLLLGSNRIEDDLIDLSEELEKD